MHYTLKQAAIAAGKTKPTILRAIQKGKISAEKGSNGEWKIDPAELHRVYERLSATVREIVNCNDTLQGELHSETQLLREMLAGKDEVIADLRGRLDRESEERRRVQNQLTAILTDQRQKQEQTERPRFWRRLLAR
jgi:hypothetical protein